MEDATMTKERRLGRGLEALLGQIPARKLWSRHPCLLRAQSSRRPRLLRPPSAAVLRRRPRRRPCSGSTPRTPRPASLPPSPTTARRRSNPHVGAAVQLPPQQQDAGSTDGQDARAPAPGRVNVRQIDSNPAQPRQDFDADEMRSLAESISTHGLLQPVVVRRVQDRYQLVAGERRLRAAIQAGWADVPVNVVEADDRQMAELAIVENLQRKDLNALEKAASFQKYLDQYKCTQEELAGRLKLDRSTIANLIRLLELPEPVQDALRRGQITQGHARALLPLGDEREQIEFCRRIQREGLNVRQTETIVQETIDAADSEPVLGWQFNCRPSGDRNAAQADPLAAGQERAPGRLGAGVPHRAGHESEDQPQRPRPRQAGRPVPQPRGVRAAEEARLRGVGLRVRAWGLAIRVEAGQTDKP